MWRALVALQATVENIRDFVWEIYYWDPGTLIKTYLQCIPLRFAVCLSFYCFLALLRNHCYSFHRRKRRLVTSICQGPGQVVTRMPFFSPKFTSAATFSAPAQEEKLFFLSGRSARKKIRNFPMKSRNLCRTSRHFWRLSSACDQCCASQLITSAEREVKVSRRSGMYQSYNFSPRLGMQSL